MADELPDIYGVCRNEGCTFVWTFEPAVTDAGTEPECPGCGWMGWPMSPREADLKHSVPNGRFTGLSCPKCSTGKLRICRSCWDEDGDAAKVNADSYVCTGCKEHMTGMQTDEIKAAAVARENA